MSSCSSVSATRFGGLACTRMGFSSASPTSSSTEVIYSYFLCLFIYVLSISHVFLFYDLSVYFVLFVKCLF